MQTTLNVFDAVMDRILFVKRAAGSELAAQEQAAKNAFGASLLFSGIRCTLQYAFLPFILPLIGIAAAATLPLMLVINLLAIVSLVLSLRRFWQIRYAHRWQYLFVALVTLLVLAAFLVSDIQLMGAAG
ncbi:MAG: hypothetical protein NZ750_14395 [Anaerolineae bacterium]|nr:hypothetical protein [Anaerolineae bacterium]MDW8170930.1 hypothetical protein [Anaerolineae bacterium]